MDGSERDYREGNAMGSDPMVTSGRRLDGISGDGFQPRSVERHDCLQGRTDDNQDSSLFLDDVSLWVTKKISGFSIIVR
jgi:hypothetical protein